MCWLLMATQYQSGSWSTPSILVGYGLSSTVGPTAPTPTDIKRLNSRSGGKHSGQGNWMQNYRPTPIMKNDKPKKMYDYGLGDLPVIQSRLPGLAARKIGKYKGLKKSTTTTTKFGVGRDEDSRVNRNDINDWLSDINSYRRMDTETVGSGSRMDTNNSDERIVIPDRVVQNNNIGPNAAVIPPPIITGSDRDIIMQLPPPYSPPGDEAARELNENWGRRMGI